MLDMLLCFRLAIHDVDKLARVAEATATAAPQSMTVDEWRAWRTGPASDVQQVLLSNVAPLDAGFEIIEVGPRHG